MVKESRTDVAVESAASRPHPDIEEYTEAVSREIADFACAADLSPQGARALQKRLSVRNGVGPALYQTGDLAIPTPSGDIAARRYQAVRSASPLPMFVFFHGGGWIGGDLDTHDLFCRHLAEQTGHLIVAIDYRLAPECPFPAAYDDAVAALEWCLDHAVELGADQSRIAAGGDSAGGNLTAAALQALRGRTGPSVGYQLLLYPALDLRLNTASMQTFRHGPGLTLQQYRACVDAYCMSIVDRSDPRLSPSTASDLSGLPPTFVLTAELDILRDEAEAYAGALIAAGVPTQTYRWPAATHGFLSFPMTVTPAREGVAYVSKILRAAWT